MRFRVLGPLEVQTPNGWTSISASKWRSLLACLLLRPGQLVPTDTLIAELWGDDPPPTANNLVSIYVHRLRKEVIADADGRTLVHRAPGYLLCVAPGELDSQVFELLVAEGRSALAAADPERAAALLAEALGLWRGPLLADVPPSPMIAAQADQAAERWLQATELRIEADLACGRAAQVVAELRGLIPDHAFRERLWALLMRALEEGGRRAEAFEAYAQARQVIADELGVDPGGELQRLHAELLAADASSVASATPQARLRRVQALPGPAAEAPALTGGVEQTPAASARAAAPARSAGIAADAAVAEPRGDRPGMIAIGTILEPGPAATAVTQWAPEADHRPLPPPLISRPAQLPADIGDFTGHETAVEQLSALLRGPATGSSPGAVRIAMINGAAGLGKTTLALHAAHQVSEEFPDGQLYVDLRGASNQPADPGQVLARFLRDFGVEGDEIPDRDDERAALYRTLLHGRRVLILLDNAKDAAQIRPLMPGSSSSTVLVTTRNRTPDLSSTRFVDINVLGDTEALALFSRIVGEKRTAAEPDATAEVLVACAGLPLAIRICASRLAARRQWRIATLAARLRNQQRRLDELSVGDLAVRSSFQVSYESLGSPAYGGVDAARVFRILGLCPEPWISLAAAAALVGAPEDEIADALETLVDVSLLESPSPGWYRLHDLLRVYATERAVAELSAEERHAAISRLSGWQDRERASDAVGPHPLRGGAAAGTQVSASDLPETLLAGSGALLEAEPGVTTTISPPAEQAGRGAERPSDSETPVHACDDDLVDAGSAAQGAGGRMAEGSAPYGRVAAGDDLCGDTAPPSSDEMLLAALRAVLASHGIVEPERVAALVRSLPKALASPEIGGQADEDPAPASVGMIPDAPGYDLRPDPLAGTTVADFIGALNQLRQWAGNPSYRKLEGQCGRAVASATICTALTGDELPTLPTVVAIVAACGGGEEQERAFSTAWRKLEIKHGPRRRKGKTAAVVTLYSVPDTA